MDDEQGPWWTRPPESGPQAPPVQRHRTSGRTDVDAEYPPVEYAPTDHPPPIEYAPPVEYAPLDYTPPEFTPPLEYPRPRLVKPETVEPVPVEPEPPVPNPAKPVVRRVAVVAPSSPPVRTVSRDPREDRTETLPAVGDDIFATFSGPSPPVTPAASSSRGRFGGFGGLGSPARPKQDNRGRVGDSPDDEAASPGPLALLSNVNLPEPRVLMLGAAAALVALLIVIVALVSGRSPKAEPTVAAPTAGPAPTTEASNRLGKRPDGLKQVTSSDAAAQLRKTGRGPGGTIVEAWGWNDRNGQNLVVTSMTTAGRKRTLRVVHVAGLDGNNPRTLRVMTDPKLPINCKGAGTASFTPKSLIVRDLDSNNVAEVITGWTSRCGGAGSESQIKLALITNGKKYILRGQGVVGSARAFVPAPAGSRWPKGYLDIVSGQYSKLYG